MRDLIPMMFPVGEFREGCSRCSFSGGPLHGRTFLMEDLVQGTGLGTLAGSPYYRRDPKERTRFRLAGTISVGPNGWPAGPYANV